MNPLAVALRGKGLLNLTRRALNIVNHYGITPRRLGRALDQLVAILEEFDCSATFPIVAAVLDRHPRMIQAYHQRGIEFAIHGYHHVDYCQVSSAEQLDHIRMAKQLFEKAELTPRGFRGPYLHANADTLTALRHHNLAYDSSQGVIWDVLDGEAPEAYHHVLRFYGALPVTEYPSLPVLEHDLVCIPYSLPDDEALVHRLALKDSAHMRELWLRILRRSYAAGELFTLGLHPERALICQDPLRAVLAEAAQLAPRVWVARLDEIAAWWRARLAAEIKLAAGPGPQFQVDVFGPSGTTVLVRDVEVQAATQPWADGYQQVDATHFTVRATRRPCIGVAPTAAPLLADLLRQQGYLVEVRPDKANYAYYYDQTRFEMKDFRPMLRELATTSSPLVRLGRWPNGARSALSITGDIDCLTLWDYVARMLE